MVNIIYFRTDANDTIATGHVMRCLTIADVLKKRGQQISFIVSDSQSEELIVKAEYNVYTLGTDWKIWDIGREADFIKQHASKKDVLVVDSYSVSSEYIRQVGKHIRTVVFDDMFSEYYPADIIINYNLYYKIFDYDSRYNQNTKLLLGGKYVPLRSQFREYHVDRTGADIENKRPAEVLLICGGGDAYNTMGQILARTLESDRNIFEQLRWNVVCGAYNGNYEQIKEMSLQNSNVIVHQNVKNMAGLMAECDVCISAASTVLYECSAMQLPTVFYCVADNQQYDADCFGENDRMLYCGDFIKESGQTIKNIISNLKKIIGDNERYLYMVEASKNSVDCNGACNIADEIIKDADIKEMVL